MPTFETTRSDEKATLAEFHDVGKIVDWRALGLQKQDQEGRWKKEPHDFEECTDPSWGIDFSAPVWGSIFRKDDPERPDIIEIRIKHFRHSSYWFLVSLADELAAGMGRLREEIFGGDPIYGYYCLWTGKPHHDPRLAQKVELVDLIRHLNGNPSWEDTCHRYGSIFHSRVETAHPGLNVTTLYSHSVLTGKIARILQPLTSVVDPKCSFPDGKKATASQKLVPVFLEIKFLQQPFRARDLSIFQARRDAIAAVVARHPDNVLIRYGNHLVALFFSREESDCFVQSFQDAGLVVSETKAEEPLSYLLSPKKGVTKVLDEAHPIDKFPALPDSIEPPICENCQMAHGQHRWPLDYLAGRTDLSEVARARFNSLPWNALRIEDFLADDRAKLGEWLEGRSEERLCSRCFELRQTALPLSRLAGWDSGRVAWARISLDLAVLEEALRRLHLGYIHSLPVQIEGDLSDKLSVRFPMLVDFVEDFGLALASWVGRVRDAFGRNGVEEIDEDFLCVKLSDARGALHLLEIYHALMEERFPKLLALDATPVRFTLSIAPAKHPFSMSWRFLESSQAPVGIQLVGSGRAEVPLKRLGEILNLIARGDRRTYHRLRKIARTSKALAELVLADRNDRDRGLESLRRILPLGMDFESLMTLANLAET